MLDERNVKTSHVAAQWWADRLEQGDKEKFKQRLAELIYSSLCDEDECNLHCDYDPDETLLQALEFSGVECRGFMFSASGILPYKTTTLITPGLIEPKEGYGNWTDKIVVEGNK